MTPDTAGDSGGEAAPGSESDSRPVVYDLAPDCTAEDVDVGANYHAVVNGVVEYGIFVDISDEVSGLVHESNLDRSYEVDDRLTVSLEEVRENGDLAFDVFRASTYQTVVVDHDPEITPIADLGVGDDVHVEGQVAQIKQTGGPTVFRVADETGIVSATAFREAGVRAFPAMDLDDVVRIGGSVESHEGALQIEVDWMARLDGDGMCASVPVQLALSNFIESVHDDEDASRHLIKRLPSKAPYYEMEDVTRDLNFALEGQSRHGQRLPFLLMLDNGSTEEDVPAYENLAHYDMPIAVVDHHHPDPEAVEDLLAAHVNPYLYDEDYRITTGMMCVELARMIDPDVTDDLRHVPAVAGLADRSKAEVMEEFIALAESEGYDRTRLLDVGEALDYAAHWLRYNDGQSLVNDVLNVGCDDEDRHRELVDFLATRAERDVERQMDAAASHLEHERLDSGAHLYTVDLDEWAHRFTYPAPGKTTGKLHDRQVTEHGEPVITIGYGPDFAVLRSDGVRLDIPRMVSELNEEVVGGGVSGGGHLVVGSIKFVKGMREDVIDRLVDKMADAELDAELSSQAVVDTEL